MQLLQRVAEVEEQQRLMQAQLADFIAKQQEENAWVRAQIGQIFSFYASDACPTAPTPPTTVFPPGSNMESPRAEAEKHATASTGGDTETGERTA